jgi:hypothetical protein
MWLLAKDKTGTVVDGSRGTHRLPGAAARPPRWRVAVDFALLGFGLLAVATLVLYLVGWPAWLVRLVHTIPGWVRPTWLAVYTCWVLYRAPMSGPVRWWRERSGHRSGAATTDTDRPR